MVGIAHNPWTRMAQKGLFGLRVAVLVAVGMLVLAASAHAQAPTGSEQSPEAGSSAPTEQAPEAGSTDPNPVQAPESGGANPAPESGAGPETGGVSPAPEQAPAPEGVSPAPEKAPEIVIVLPAPEKAPEIVSIGPAPEKVQEIISVGPPTEKTPEIVKIDPLPEKMPEVTNTAPPAEKEPESNGAGAEKGTEGPPAPPALTRNDAGYTAPEIGYEAAPDVSGALIGSPTDPPSVGSPEAATSEIAASAAALAGISAARRAGQLNCELSSLGGMTDGCSAELLGTQQALSQAPAGYAAAVAALAPPSPPPGDGGHGGAAVGSPPVSPGPGPAPSGAAGSSAGATGLALSGFLTLAGLLLLGAPRAMRRLRLSCQPWLTACFVLIPERPG
jgi:hypothetical protein